MIHPVGGQKSYWAIAPRRVRGVPGVGPGVSPGLQIISGVVWTPDFLKAGDFGLLALESSGLGWSPLDPGRSRLVGCDLLEAQRMDHKGGPAQSDGLFNLKRTHLTFYGGLVYLYQSLLLAGKIKL